MLSQYKLIISVIICTYNRAEFAAKAVKSLLNQTLEKKLYEIIVVDNASDDETSVLMKREFSSEENFTYIFEPALGLSIARNTGLRFAAGEYVAFLDDDAVAEPNWLKELVKVFQYSKDIYCVGGKIELDWKTLHPKWLSPVLYSFLTYLDAGKTHPLKKPALGGANIAFRKKAFEEIGKFPVCLGRIGKTQMAGEETALQQKLLNLGYKVYYSAEAVVKHFVHKDRLSKPLLLERAFFQGVSNTVMCIMIAPSRKSLITGLLRNLILSLLKNLPLFFILFFLPEERFKRLVFLYCWAGGWFGLIKLKHFSSSLSDFENRNNQLAE